MDGAAGRGPARRTRKAAKAVAGLAGAAVIGLMYMGGRVQDGRDDLQALHGELYAPAAVEQAAPAPGQEPSANRIAVWERAYGLRNLGTFESRYPGELGMIAREVERRKTTKPYMYGTEPHGDLVALVVAIRHAEEGVRGREYGVIPTPEYESDPGYVMVRDGIRFYDSSFADDGMDKQLDKQIVYCAGTCQEKMRDWLAPDNFPGQELKSPAVQDRWDDIGYIRFLASRYAPERAKNDPLGLNAHWLENVVYWFSYYTGSVPH